jgi:hypothetical protein
MKWLLSLLSMFLRQNPKQVEEPERHPVYDASEQYWETRWSR